MNVEQAIQQLLEDLTRAWNSRDWLSFSRLFAENADYVTGSGMRLSGRGPIHNAFSTRAFGAFESDRMSLVTKSIKTLGPDAAPQSRHGLTTGLSWRRAARSRPAESAGVRSLAGALARQRSDLEKAEVYERRLQEPRELLRGSDWGAWQPHHRHCKYAG